MFGTAAHHARADKRVAAQAVLACEGAEAASQQSAGTHRRAGAAHSRLCAAGLVVDTVIQLAKAGAALHHCRLLVGGNLRCVTRPHC